MANIESRWLFFPPAKGVVYRSNSGSKGKGTTIDSLVDRAGNPLVVLVTDANESELASIQIQTVGAGGPGQKPINLATDADTIRVNQEGLDQERGLAQREPKESGKRESKIEEGK